MDLQTAFTTYLNAHLATGRFTGTALIVRGDEVLFANGYGLANQELKVPNTLQTKFRIGSITKQFTAAAILQLQEQGLLNVSDRISQYLPDYPNGDRITLHHLLTHTAGIPNFTSFPEYRIWKYQPTTLDEVLARFQDLPLEFEPGEKWSYSNSGYILLTKIIETVSSQTYTRYVEQNIFQPLGMANSGYDDPLEVVENRASGYQFLGEGYRNAEFIHMSITQGAGALYSTVEDLALWNRALYNGNFLSKASLEAMTTPHISMTGDEDPDVDYGYGLVLDRHLDYQRIAHAGGVEGFLTFMAHYPMVDLTVIVLSNIETAPSGVIGQDLVAIAFGKPYDIPKYPEVVEIPPKRLEQYVGD